MRLRRRLRKEKLLSRLSRPFPPFGCQSPANLSRGNHFRSVGGPHELALDWLDTYLRSGKRTIDGGGGGSGRVGAIKFTIAEGAACVSYMIEPMHARTFSRYRPMFIFDINLVDVCGPRLVRYIILINYFNEYKRNRTRAMRTFECVLLILCANITHEQTRKTRKPSTSLNRAGAIFTSVTAPLSLSLSIMIALRFVLNYFPVTSLTWKFRGIVNATRDTVARVVKYTK